MQGPVDSNPQVVDVCLCVGVGHSTLSPLKVPPPLAHSHAHCSTGKGFPANAASEHERLIETSSGCEHWYRCSTFAQKTALLTPPPPTHQQPHPEGTPPHNTPKSRKSGAPAGKPTPPLMVYTPPPPGPPPMTKKGRRAGNEGGGRGHARTKQCFSLRRTAHTARRA